VDPQVDAACRAHDPPIPFITADVRGVFGSVFVDCGAGFEVADATGESPREVLLSAITQEEVGVVTTIENRMHGLEDGDSVLFKEVGGMTEINGTVFAVKVVNPYKFTIGDTRGMSAFVGPSGLACQLVRKRRMDFQSLEEQIAAPAILTTDFAKFESPAITFAAFLALHDFEAAHSRYPVPGNSDDVGEFGKLLQLRHKSEGPLGDAGDRLVRQFAWTCSGSLAPLCAALGGWVAQEALKVCTRVSLDPHVRVVFSLILSGSDQLTCVFWHDGHQGLTGKFTPLEQLLCMDIAELAPVADDSCDPADFAPLGDR
jgi:hypothetical protein